MTPEFSEAPLPDAVFKAYDIRGVVPEQLNADFAHLLGRALAQQAHSAGVPSLVVGCDGRLSSPELSAALQQGVMQGGVNVLDVGTVPTPLVYFAAHLYQDPACQDSVQEARNGAGASGVMITGSHNPPQYNGFKMMLDGVTLHGPLVQELKTVMQQFAAVPDSDQAHATQGTRRQMDITPDYIRRITDDVKLARPMKIAIDCGNGVAGAVAPQLFEALGCQVDTLFCEVDGRFPNHHPDPADPHNLQDLIVHVQQHGCELGLAFDGDGDRLGVVIPSGEIIWPDRQLILYARDILTRQPGATIIFDVKCSRHVGEAVRQAGGQPLMWQTGHSMIKAKLKEIGAALAGEMSGHTFFKERWYGFDDGLYTGARLLEILSRSADAAAMLAALPKGISTPELKIPMQEGQPHILIRALQTQGQFSTATQCITIDGVRAEYADGFGLARASNTTPVVVLRFEADTDAALQRIQAEFRTALLALDAKLALPF